MLLRTSRLRNWACVVLWLSALSLLPTAAQRPSQSTDQQIWWFNSIGWLGDHPTKVLGHPKVIETPFGKAIHFNGIDDALLVDVHPLAGARTWTWEMIFKPDADGKPAQRIFHLQSVDPKTGEDIKNERMLFEIRIVKDQWCLDSFAISGEHRQTLLNCEKLHPFRRWYRVTAVYDGQMLRNYVGDEMQGEGELELPPPHAGHASVGTRIDRRDWFKGAIYEARFTDRALAPNEFLQLPNQ